MSIVGVYWTCSQRSGGVCMGSLRCLLQALGHGNSAGHGHTDHGVVAGAQEAHHLHVRGDGGAACELGVGVHAAHGVGHAVAGGAGGHVVGVQRAAGAAAGGHGEVLLGA